MGFVAFVAAVRRYEDVVKARNEEAAENQNQGKVRNDEAEDIERIVGNRSESRVGEAEDDGQDGSVDVSQQRSPPDWEVPVLALAYNLVEIVAKLVALEEVVSLRAAWKAIRRQNLQSRSS